MTHKEEIQERINQLQFNMLALELQPRYEESRKYIEINNELRKLTDMLLYIDDEKSTKEAPVISDLINEEEHLMVITREKIRNSNIIETGRARQRNRNDIYTNLIIGCLIGRVDSEYKRKDGKNRQYTEVLYEKDIDKRLQELKDQGYKVPSKTRLTKDLKLLNKQLGIKYVDIVNTPSGIAYRIAQSYEGKYFTVVPIYKIKELTLCSNKEMLRLFITISMHKDISTENYVSMSRSYLCKCMDIEVTEGNLNYIGTMTTALMKLGLIDILVDDLTFYENGQYVSKPINHYRLTTYEEFQEKGRIKKKRRSSEPQ